MTKQLFVPSVKHVDKHTRAGNNGKEIKCPNCCAPAKVYHFSWSALVCQYCGKSINKGEWLLND